MFVPNNCTNLLQPIDLSVNKPFKNHLRKCFAEWYSQKVSTGLAAGTPIDNISVNTTMSIKKEVIVLLTTSSHIQISSLVVL